MINQQFVAYVRAARAVGITNQDIITSLKDAGWTDVLVEAGFHALVTSSGSTHPVLQARALTKSYTGNGQDSQVLRGIDVSLERGQSVAIVGKSGSGKSTLMHILATLDRPTTGELLVDGRPTSGLTSQELDALRNKKFGFVFQQFFVNARNSCLENVTLPLTIMGVALQERQSRGMDMLQAVGLADKAHAPAGQLSGGQKQRLCIARALITEPEVIFADEPTGNLDTENGANVIELLFRLQREKGITLIIVTHDNDLATLCQRIITIKDGDIITDTIHAS